VVLHFRREEELVGMGCWDFAWMEWRMRDLVGREGKGDHGGGGDWFVYNMKYLSLHARVLLFFVIVVACTRGLRDRTHRYRVYGCDDGRLVYIKVRLRYHGEGSASCAMPGCRRRLVAQWLVCMRL
jgi:hypothetical protein